MATTSGFIPRSGVLPQFTPVDPRLAVADPASLLQGINSGMAQTRLLQADQYARELAPFQQQLAMAQAQQQIAALPQQEKLRQFSFDAAQRQDTLARLQPFEVLGNKFIDTDPASGALAEFQEVKTLDPSTGQLVGSAAKLSRVLETPQDRERKDRTAEALALQREAQAEKYFKQATTEPTVKNNVRYFYDYANNQIIQRTVDASGKEVGQPTVVMGPDGKPVPPPPQQQGGDLFATPTAISTSEIDSFGSPGAQAQDPFASTVTGTSVPNVEFIPPQFSFQSEGAVNQAAAQGLLQDGQPIMVNGVRARWQAGP